MREKHSSAALFLLASLLLVGAGCGQATTTNTSAPQSGRPNATFGTACANPYYPFKAGLAITYGATAMPNNVTIPDYTLRIASVTGTTAAIRVDMSGGIGSDMTADCVNGSIVVKGTFDLGTAMQETTKIKTTTVSQSGTYFPADAAIGSTWSNEQTVRVEMTDSPIANMGPLTSSTTATSKAIANEKVSVPAGTFDALKVEVTRVTTASFAGIPGKAKPPSIPPQTSTSTEWWAKGIGLVKSVTADQGTTMTVEAKSVIGQ